MVDMNVSTGSTIVGITATGTASDRLLDALGEVIAEVGPRSVSLRAVARRAGLSHAAPGHCFGDLDGMLAAFARQGFEELSQRLETAVAEDRDPLDQLKSVAFHYVEFATEHPGHFDAMFRIGLDKTNHPELMAAAAGARQLLAEPASRLIQESKLGWSADEVGLHFWALAHGFASLAVDGQLEAIYPDRTIDNLLDGVLGLTDLSRG